MVEMADVIWADGAIPSDAQIRAWGTWVENLLRGAGTNSALSYETLSALSADLSHAANTMAWVLDDLTAANNGIYQKSGDVGDGFWLLIGDLPYSFIIATNSGAGTASALQAITDIPLTSSTLVLLNIVADNDLSPVTVSFNGGSPLTMKSNSNQDIAPCGLVANMIVMGVISGNNFRIVTDQVSSAVVADFEAKYAEFKSQYLGSYAADPTVDAGGNAVREGAFYWNTTTKIYRYYDGAVWSGFPVPTSPAAGSVVLASLASALLATQGQAEAAADNATLMTPQRTAQLGDKRYPRTSGYTTLPTITKGASPQIAGYDANGNLVPVSQAGVSMKGAYSSATLYAVNDIVQYNGTLWRCKSPAQNITPATTGVDTWWEIWLAGSALNDGSVTVAKLGSDVFTYLNANYLRLTSKTEASIAEFGALPGNTAAQNKTAIQNALDSMAAKTSGGSLWVPETTYNCDGGLIFATANANKSIELRGNKQASLINFVSGTYGIRADLGIGAYIQDGINITVTNAPTGFDRAVWVESNIEAGIDVRNSCIMRQGTTPAISCLYVERSTFGNFENLKLKAGADTTYPSGGTGIYMVGDDNIGVDNSCDRVRVYQSGIGFDMDLSAGTGKLEGTRFNDCSVVGASIGLRVSASSGDTRPPIWQWKGGHINASQYCMFFRRAAQVDVEGAALYAEQSSAIAMIHIELSAMGQIRNNQLVHVNQLNGTPIDITGINVDSGAESFNILDNQLIATGSSTMVAVRSGANNSYIRGNRFRKKTPGNGQVLLNCGSNTTNGGGNFQYAA
ncbi:hypothetical protein G6K93_07855 [Agrobacterium rhizogenes]|nr:hypothetical protein [Rhizobium rhizogenes]